MNIIPEHIEARGMTFLKHYGTFELCEILNFEPEHPGLGCALQYFSKKEGKATIYVYNKGLGEIPNGPVSEIAKLELVLAGRDIVNKHSSPGCSAEVVKAYGIGSPTNKYDFSCAEFLIRNETKSYLSILFITASNNNFVKVRVTPTDSAYAVDTAMNFIANVAPSLCE